MNGVSIMEYFIVNCEDGSCCCIPQRSAVVFIGIICLFSSIIDSLTNGECCSSYRVSHLLEHVETLKSLLQTMFQMANTWLLLGAIVKSAALIQMYVWYIMAYVVLRLTVSVAEFVFKFGEASIDFLEFFIDWICLFVIYQCLPLVDAYRKYLNGKFYNSKAYF